MKKYFCSSTMPDIYDDLQPSTTLPRAAKKRGKLLLPIVPSVTSPPAVAATVSTPNRSFIRFCHKARRVRFFRNGDQYFKVCL
jgi:hypothetical protein